MFSLALGRQMKMDRTVGPGLSPGESDGMTSVGLESGIRCRRRWIPDEEWTRGRLLWSLTGSLEHGDHGARGWNYVVWNVICNMIYWMKSLRVSGGLWSHLTRVM